MFSLASQPMADHKSASDKADFAFSDSKLNGCSSESKFQMVPAFNPIVPFVMMLYLSLDVRLE